MLRMWPMLVLRFAFPRRGTKRRSPRVHQQAQVAPSTCSIEWAKPRLAVFDAEHLRTLQPGFDERLTQGRVAQQALHRHGNEHR